tara:strand:+ start:8288 stop:14317 length:6030 start_codon:yes stop_codon:yes gene_type:complete
MSGLLLSSDNIYGLVNPPPDPVDDLPELHQTIGSAAVRWDYFVDLSNNIGDHLVGGDNVTITGNVISVAISNSSSDSSGNSTSTNTVVSRAQLTNVDLCNNRMIELTFDSSLNYLETYDLGNFNVSQNNEAVNLGEIFIKDGRANISLDYSSNAVLDASNNTQLINPNNLSGQVYFETFNDTKHIGNFQTKGTFEAGINNIGYSKKGVSGEGLFNLTTSDMPTGVKAVSFWVKDYECAEQNWFMVSDIVRLNGLAVEIFVDSTNTLAAYGENLKKLFFDGTERTLAPRNSNLPFTLVDITPSLIPSSFNGWHHVYIEFQSAAADIELLSRNGLNNSVGSLDEIRMYNRGLTSTEIKGLAVTPYLTTISDLSGILIKYTRDLGDKDNLKTITGEEIQHFIYYNGTEYYTKEVLSYIRRIDMSLNRIVLDISDLSQNVNQSIADLSQNVNVRLDDLSGNINQTITDLSQNVNVRLEDLSQTMIESIVPVMTDVSLNDGTIEINFTKDVSNQTTYDVSNFTVRYDDETKNYNTMSVENGNVILKQLTESGSGTALLTGVNSSLTTQSYSASTEQSSSSSTATKAFDGQLTGQPENTWKSSTGLYRDVSGSGGGSSTTPYDLASQSSTLYSGSTSQYSHSSYYPDAQEGHNAFDAGTRSSAPHGGTNVFVWSSSSKYSGGSAGASAASTTVDGVSISGEWIQVDVSASVVVKSFKHLPSTSGDYGYANTRQVKTAILASSTDNTTWTEIGDVSFASIPTTESTHTPTSLTAGRYFRYIVKENHGNSNTQVKELTLLGITETQYNAERTGAYLGSNATQGYSGEWIQINMGDPKVSGISTKVNSFTIKPQQNTTSSIIKTHPSEFKLFASNNSSSWTEISSTTDLSDGTWYSNSAFKNHTTTLSSPQEYQYWRLVIGRVVNAEQVSIGELELNGTLVTNNGIQSNDVNKLEIAYRRNADAAKNLIDFIGGGEINEFIYKGLGLTNITKERFTDLSDASLNSITEGQFVKFDGTHFVPTNDISDISQNLANVNDQLTTLLTSAPTTLDTLKEIADVLGDPTDASGGIGTILNKIQDISDDIVALSNQSSTDLGDLSGQVTSNITDLSTNVFNRIQISDKKQTFFEMMTQQPHAFSASGEVIASAADVTINWNYDNILANSTNTLLAKLAFQNTLKQKSLPFIDNITLEISGNINTGNSSYDNNTNSWITFTTGIWPKTFGNSEDYNTSSYKTLTINKVSQEQANSNSINNILSKTDPFDVRIYGTNYSENFPTIDNRSLYFYDLSFVTALAPSTPQFSSENAISSNSSITFNYFVAETELNAPSSNGVLIDASNTYFDFETTSSAVSGSAITNTNIQTNTNISNVAKNTNYSISISSLRAGTKYRFSTSARNNLTSSTSYSQTSSTITSSFTRLPSSSGASTPASSWFSVSTYAYRISTPTGGGWSGDNLSNSSVRYLNKSNNDYLQLLNSTRTFEISLPYSSTQQNTQVGYGKFIDNSSNLTEVAFYIDGTEKQELVYGGFGVSPLRVNKNANTVNYFSSPSSSDPYNGNAKQNGFRLNGSFSVQDILHSNVGVPSSTGYSLNYTFDKHADVGGNSISSTFKVYVDEITGNPTITRDGTETYVTALSYCMGIPSVETFDLSFNRSYSNVNSQYQYTRYHTSSPAGITVGLLYSVSKTNRSSSSYSGKINIDRTDINTTGQYSFNSTVIDSKTSNRFRDIYFTQNIGTPTSSNPSPGDTVSINEKSFNLNGETSTTNNQSFTYYCDYSSFNKSNSKITTPLISVTNLGEITNMAVFNTQLNSIATTAISNHQQLLNDWTLLFVNGRFKSNTAHRYPNVTGYTWTKPPGEGAFTTPLTYNSGTTAYYLNGSTTGSGNKYKWIAFKFTESDATTTTVSGIQYTYLNVYNLLSQYYLTSTVLGYLKNSSNNNVLGFIQQTYNSASRIGNLSRGYSPSAIWYSQDASSTFDTLFEGENKSNYGCVFEENSTNWGPILDTTNGSTNITIYIGFNNEVSLQ